MMGAAAEDWPWSKRSLPACCFGGGCAIRIWIYIDSLCTMTVKSELVFG